MPESELSPRLVVSYLYKGSYRATLHVLGCGILKRAMLEAATKSTRVTDLQIWNEPVYERAMRAQLLPAPHEHSCVTKAEAAEQRGAPESRPSLLG